MDYYADDSGIDWISVHQVAKDQQRMKLRRRERVEAIKIMSARGFSAAHQAWLLKMDPKSLRSFCKYNKLDYLPRERHPAHWTLGYVDRRR